MASSLLGKRRKGIAILVHDLAGDFHRFLEIGIVQAVNLKAAAGEFDDIEIVADASDRGAAINSVGRMSPSELPIFLIWTTSFMQSGTF